MRAAIVTARPDPAAMLIPRTFHLYAQARLEGGSYDVNVERSGETEAVKALARVMVRKALVGANTTGDATGEAMVALEQAFGAWSDTLRSRSIFFRLMADGAFSVAPFRQNIGIATSSITGGIVAEGKPIPLSRFALAAGDKLAPLKAAALIVMTDELIRGTAPETLALINRELSGAVSDVVDGEFLSIILGGSTPSLVSLGNADDAHHDLLRLMSQVNSLGNARLYFAVAADVAKGAAALFDTATGRVFPDMTPLGGSMLGVPAVVVSRLAPGTIVLIDGPGIAANRGEIAFEISRHGTLQMESVPTNASDIPTETTQVSLWQNGLSATKVLVDFGAHVLREGHVARMSDVPWGVVGSPV